MRDEIVSLAKVKGFSSFTPIQEKAFPMVLEGKNCLVVAPTGFGKTEAVVFPAFSKMLDLRDSGFRDGIQLIYVTPLKALNRDLLSRMEFFCKMLGFKMAVRHGDTTSNERSKQRDSPPHFLITTPESLQSILIAPKLKDALANVRFVVIDEVHELAGSKRGLQLSLALERLRALKRRLSEWTEVEEGRKKQVSKDFQLLALSATVGNIEEIKCFLGNDVELAGIDLKRALELKVVKPREVYAHGFEGVFAGLRGESAGRVLFVKDLIEKSGKTLVFVNTRYMAEALGVLLTQLPPQDVAVHHSSLSKDARLEVESEFKKLSSKLKAVICTSSLELGIDIGDIDQVIQFGSPRQVSRLLQRVGRSGHRRDLVAKGVVVALDEVDFAEALVLCDSAKHGRLDVFSIRKKALDVLAHQCAGLLLDSDCPLVTDSFLELFSKSYAFNSITKTDVFRCLNQLASSGLIAFDGLKASATKKTKFYYYENVSTIPDSKRFFVRDAVTRKFVGTLDEDFVSEYLADGITFIARGRAWKVMSQSDDEVVVEASADLSAAVPEWSGEEIPVPFEVAQEVAQTLSGVSESAFCSKKELDSFNAFAEKQAAFFTVPKQAVVLEGVGSMFVLHAFFGHAVNESLSMIFSSFLSSSLKTSVRARAGAYSIIFEFPKPIAPESVASVFRKCFFFDAKRYLSTTLRSSSLFRHRFVHVAKRFGLLKKNREYRAISMKKIVEVMKTSVIADEAFEELCYDRLDLANCQNVLDALSKREYSFELLYGESFSPIAKNALSLGGFGELISVAEPTEKVLEAFLKDLHEKKIEFTCLFCKNSYSRLLKEVNDLKCPFCSSTEVTLEKYVGEKNERRVASLLSSYGLRGLKAIATYGVGPETASRVLSRLHAKEEDFLMDLLEAQKDFIRTRKYWRV